MKLDVFVRGKKVAQLYRQSDDYFFKFSGRCGIDRFCESNHAGSPRPVALASRLASFFRQNLPEGYLLTVIREAFARFLDKAMAAAGFSDPEPADPEKVTIGRSELLAAPRKKSKRR